MPKSFPRIVNLYLDQWMFEQAAGVINPAKKIKILDLGCGYGRLSRQLLKAFPKAETVGVDISPNYIKLYNQDLRPRGRALKVDIRKLPFKNNSFDVVVMMATLMYVVDKSDQKKVMQEIFRVLKTDGKFIFIERNPLGYAWVTAGGLVGKIRGQKHREISAVSFEPRYLSKLIKSSGSSVGQLRGLPFGTLFLPGLIITGLLSEKLTSWMLAMIKPLDKIFTKFITFSLYVAYIGRK